MFHAALEATQGQIDGFLVNSQTNATRIGWRLWEIYLTFAPGLPPGWLPAINAPAPRRKRTGRHPILTLSTHIRVAKLIKWCGAMKVLHYVGIPG